MNLTERAAYLLPLNPDRNAPVLDLVQPLVFFIAAWGKCGRPMTLKLARDHALRLAVQIKCDVPASIELDGEAIRWLDDAKRSRAAVAFVLTSLVVYLGDATVTPPFLRKRIAPKLLRVIAAICYILENHNHD